MFLVFQNLVNVETRGCAPRGNWVAFGVVLHVMAAVHVVLVQVYYPLGARAGPAGAAADALGRCRADATAILGLGCVLRTNGRGHPRRLRGEDNAHVPRCQRRSLGHVRVAPRAHFIPGHYDARSRAVVRTYVGRSGVSHNAVPPHALFARMLGVLASHTTPFRLTRCSHVC
jgi:hypothetical protein